MQRSNVAWHGSMIPGEPLGHVGGVLCRFELGGLPDRWPQGGGAETTKQYGRIYRCRLFGNTA